MAKKTKDKKEEFDKIPEKKYKIETEEKNSSKNKLIKAYNYLQEKFEFRYNEITLETEYRKKGSEEWLFFDDAAYRDIDQEVALKSVSISERFFKNWVYGNKLRVKVNPLRDYFKSLDKWDKHDGNHIWEYLRQVKLSDENQRSFFYECFTKWLVAMVTSIMDDHITNQTCFVLVSEQGRFKTTFLNGLVPKQYRLDYLYSSSFIAHNKDHEKYLSTKWLINLDEMQAFNRSDIESIKSKITQDRVVLRLPYAKADVKAWRVASFCGSVNKEEFLNDATGSRRFLPFKIDDIKLNPELNIDKVYAQAYSLFKSGDFKYWFDREDITKLESHNEPHKETTMEADYTLKNYRVPTEDEIRTNPDVEYLTASDIMADLCKKYERLNANNTVKRNIGLTLQSNGFQKVSKRLTPGGKPVWVWIIIKRNINELFNMDDTDVNKDKLLI